MSFTTSLSGLSANQQKLDVIGNNLANINTIAFKASDLTFADLVSQTVGGSSVNPMQIGLGVTTGSISPNFHQGGISNTGVPTNVAIQGNGFFVIGDAANRSYTRAGDFSQDANGTLVTSDGRPVQGYTATDPVTGAIVTTGQPGNIVVPPGVLRSPIATTLFSASSNLDAGAAVGATFTASPQVYDSLGTAHVVTVTYKNTAPGVWDYSITVPGADLTPAVPPVASVELKKGTVKFDSNGVLQDVDGTTATSVPPLGPNFSVKVQMGTNTWQDGAATADMNWSLVDANGVPNLTGYAAPSQTSSLTQNGQASGMVSGVSIDTSGQIVATIGAGQTVVLGQLALANFNNPGGLQKLGANGFGETAAAGIANIGVAGTGGRGTLIGSSIEQSNVDMAQEFTQMILAQRGYEANSKSITTADQLLQETLSLKQ
jgi:flagellar hook protein FlgE